MTLLRGTHLLTHETDNLKMRRVLKLTASLSALASTEAASPNGSWIRRSRRSRGNLSFEDTANGGYKSLAKRTSYSKSEEHSLPSPRSNGGSGKTEAIRFIRVVTLEVRIPFDPAHHSARANMKKLHLPESAISQIPKASPPRQFHAAHRPCELPRRVWQSQAPINMASFQTRAPNWTRFKHRLVEVIRTT